MPETVLKISELRTSRVGKSGTTDLLTNVNVDVHRGEIVGIVGESGVGKSLLMASVLNLLNPSVQLTGGEVQFGSRDLAQLSEAELGRIRGKEISFIGPNPHTLLNPLLPVGRQVVNFVRSHERLSKTEAQDRVLEMFKAVGIPDAKRRLESFPHELSGGMAQRVVISVGLICSPQVILADEPTFGLDVTIQAQVLELIRKLVGSRDDRAMLIATRDLSIIANYADTVHVLHDGTVVESATVLDFFRGPTSEQGRKLLHAAELRREVNDEGVATRTPA